MISQNSSAGLQRQMRHIRRDLNEHADQMVETARNQFDWRRYVANHPWGSIAAAAAVGFFLVPRRACCKGVDAQTVKETVNQVVQASHPGSPLGGSLVGWLFALLATALVREAVALVPQLARQWLQQGEGRSDGEPSETAERHAE